MVGLEKLLEAGFCNKAGLNNRKEKRGNDETARGHHLLFSTEGTGMGLASVPQEQLSSIQETPHLSMENSSALSTL